MKEDLNFLPVENIWIAIARKFDELNNEQWNVYIINKNENQLKNVLITSKGYGEVDGKKQKTSILRHYFDELDSNGVQLIEPIDPAVFHLYNEYWISYYINQEIYDKKYIFVPGSICEENLINISELNLDGVLHS